MPLGSQLHLFSPFLKIGATLAHLQTCGIAPIIQDFSKIARGSERKAEIYLFLTLLPLYMAMKFSKAEPIFSVDIQCYNKGILNLE